MESEDSELEEQPLRTESHSFIVRVWRQKTGNTKEDPVWRGSIDHVGASERLYFSDLAAIGRFIQDQAKIGLHGHFPRWKSMLERFVNWIRN